jgi:molecular chaperone GrpE
MASPHSIVDEADATEAVDMETLRAENASLRDRLLRALAEAENTRRRADRAIEDASKFSIAEFARELLTIVDNLQCTVDAGEGQASPTAENAALVEGVRAILRILMHTLQRFGIRRIEALGQNFDPSLHEAVAQVEDQSKPPGTVTQVVEDGYMMHDRLLQPARVFVSKQSSDASSVPTDRDSDSEQPTTGQRQEISLAADPYIALGVKKNASQDESQKAYRRLAKKLHPDLNPGNKQAEERFKEISAAYDLLGDPDKRARFDRGEIDASGMERPQQPYYRDFAEGGAYASDAGFADFAGRDAIFS